MRRLILCIMIAASAAFGCACAPSDTESAAGNASQTVAGPFENFTAKGILGEDYTQEVFAGRDVSIVNIMATWCGPCISEMPDLENVYENSGIGVVGIVLDTSSGGEVDNDAVSVALQLAERLGITYPMLIPDASDFSGLTSTIQVVPTSYLVDSKGAVIAGPLEGAMSEEAWLEVAAKAADAAA